eukprot:TRINITY_DN7964_c0_g1::TRINITY_DN7964_c0_g1_i1::g.15531::m.15531 TRINITY_DN7964_c0_g1::TRINITY_DN7964_c0_g1_i1::g.15531  ORF type:complete len:240 (+),score=34.06,EF-hand_6/PF13405.1/0.091,EF-hand_6/PF13405.1/3.6,EF-hand_6/PF13405.1/1.3e+04,EF-hand_6/PF13405.1/7.2e+02,EF-hand_7/PF13499.1/8.3e-05,EF-hand_7/PF13499.1/1.2e+03,EF-hand_7/PF13499.1/2.9e+03,EF-hand_7/PF13499.1/9.5e+02,EF-hand_1/PF00036.27/0.46,EF-hand_1/PF00036.27/4.1,EF-hand_1/PF00036.27/3.3e+03,EF-hand_1/PF00036.27/2.6e+03,EF-hand_1/P
MSVEAITQEAIDIFTGLDHKGEGRITTHEFLDAANKFLPDGTEADFEYLLTTFMDKEETGYVTLSDFVSGYREIRDILDVMSTRIDKNLNDSQLVRLRALLLSSLETNDDDITNVNIVGLKQRLIEAGFSEIDTAVIQAILDANFSSKDLSFKEFNTRFRVLFSSKSVYDKKVERKELLRYLSYFERLQLDSEYRTTYSHLCTTISTLGLPEAEVTRLLEKLKSSPQVSFTQFAEAFTA